jgi:L-fuculose-phosphate aldolase
MQMEGTAVYEDSSTTRSEIVNAAQATWDLGLNSLRSGNVSVLLPTDNILITKSGRSLRGLNPYSDLIVVNPSETDRGEASCEFYVHRGIYKRATRGRSAILHCHPLYTVAASWICNEKIPPAYNEAKDVLGQTLVLESQDQEQLGEDPAGIARALTENKIVAVRGHGTFALAETLDECLYLTHLLENSCHVLFLRSEAVSVNTLLGPRE